MQVALHTELRAEAVEAYDRLHQAIPRGCLLQLPPPVSATGASGVTACTCSISSTSTTIRRCVTPSAMIRRTLRGRRRWCRCKPRRTTTPAATRPQPRLVARRPGRWRLTRDLVVDLTPPISGDQRLLRSRRDLLHRPAVAVGVAEREQRAAVAGIDDADLARLDTSTEQLGARRLGVGDDELNALQRTRLHLAACPAGRRTRSNTRIRGGSAGRTASPRSSCRSRGRSRPGPGRRRPPGRCR